MSGTGRGKRKEEEQEQEQELVASDEGEGEGGGTAPPKKISKKDSSNNNDDSDDVVVCEISKNRRVSVRNWQGRIVVDIREFYVKDGKQCPGKKGISLTMDQWNILRDHVDEIDKAVNENS